MILDTLLELALNLTSRIAGDKLSLHWVLTAGSSFTESYYGPIQCDMVLLRKTESLRYGFPVFDLSFL